MLDGQYPTMCGIKKVQLLSTTLSIHKKKKKKNLSHLSLTICASLRFRILLRTSYVGTASSFSKKQAHLSRAKLPENYQNVLFVFVLFKSTRLLHKIATSRLITVWK